MASASPEFNFLYQYLRDCYEQGKMATHEEALEVYGIDIKTGKHRDTFRSARRRLMLDLGYKFQHVNGVGCWPIKDVEKVASIIVDTRTAKIRSQVKRMREEVDACPLEGMSGAIAQAQATFYEQVVDPSVNEGIRKAVQEQEPSWFKSAQKASIDWMISIGAG